MDTFTNPFFWLNFIYFFFAVFFSFYIPGNLLVRKLEFSSFNKTILSIILGLVLWAWQGIAFGYLGTRWMTYGYVLLVFLLWLYVHRPKKGTLQVFPSFPKLDFLLAGIIVIGTLVQLLAVWFIGVETKGGLEFCCFWPDSFYHLALTSELVKNVPPFEPGMAGLVVKNYHYLGNLVVAELVRIYRLPLIYTHYHFASTLISPLLGLSAVLFATQTKIPQKQFSRWLVFFLYFSGDIIFIALFFLGKGVNFGLNVSENATTLWFSPPRMYAIIIFFAGTALFYYFIKTKNKTSGILSVFLLGSLIGFKVYVGLLALIGLGFVFLHFLFIKQYKLASFIPLAFFLSALLYFPVNKDSGGLVFVGLWRLEDFAVRPLWNFINIEFARRAYLEKGNFLKVAIIEICYFLLYLYSLCGMFLLGFIQNKKSFQIFIKPIHIYLLSGLGISFIVGIFFFQSIGGGNTLQFLFSIYIIGSVYAAIACSYWLAKIPKPWVSIVSVIIILLVSGRVIREIYRNTVLLLRHEGYYSIESEEVQALQFLRNNTEKNATIAVPNEVSLENTCYYLNFMSNRQMFLCGNGILQDHGVDTTRKAKLQGEIFRKENSSLAQTLLKENNIDYMYIPASLNLRVIPSLEEVFKNEKVIILKVDKSE